jgi:hypothetical protein
MPVRATLFQEVLTDIFISHWLALSRIDYAGSGEVECESALTYRRDGTRFVQARTYTYVCATRRCVGAHVVQELTSNDYS